MFWLVPQSNWRINQGSEQLLPIWIHMRSGWTWGTTVGKQVPWTWCLRQDHWDHWNMSENIWAWFHLREINNHRCYCDTYINTYNYMYIYIKKYIYNISSSNISWQCRFCVRAHCVAQLVFPQARRDHYLVIWEISWQWLSYKRLRSIPHELEASNGWVSRERNMVV